MKLFFDSCEIKHFDPIGRITLLLSGPDIDKFFPILQEIHAKGNPPVDITLNYPWMQLNEIICVKCKGLTKYLVRIPNRANYKEGDEGNLEFIEAQTKALTYRPPDLNCKNCGDPID